MNIAVQRVVRRTKYQLDNTHETLLISLDISPFFLFYFHMCTYIDLIIHFILQEFNIML